MYSETETAPAPLTNCGNTGAIIPGTLATERVKAFKDSKKFHELDTVTMTAVANHAEPVYQLDLDLFLGLLKKFKAADYNGIRVYFACYPDDPNEVERDIVPTDKEGQLTLIFVPTRKHNNLITGTDDPTEFWHLGSDGQLTHLPIPGTVPVEQDIVTSWVRHYRKNRMNVLEQDGKASTNNPNFQETRSHWYNLDNIAGNGATDIGLISYVTCARQQAVNPITELYIQWAAFLATEKEPDKFPKYQLSIIFYLRQQLDPPPNKDNMFPIANPIVFGSIMSEAADTGLPCPPLTYCPGSGISPDL
jgi:hypothetical protein